MINLPEWLYMKSEYKPEKNSYFVTLTAKFPRPLVYKGKFHGQLNIMIRENELQERLQEILYAVELESRYL